VNVTTAPYVKSAPWTWPLVGDCALGHFTANSHILLSYLLFIYPPIYLSIRLFEQDVQLTQGEIKKPHKRVRSSHYKYIFLLYSLFLLQYIFLLYSLFLLKFPFSSFNLEWPWKIINVHWRLQRIRIYFNLIDSLFMNFIHYTNSLGNTSKHSKKHSKQWNNHSETIITKLLLQARQSLQQSHFQRSCTFWRFWQIWLLVIACWVIHSQ